MHPDPLIEALVSRASEARLLATVTDHPNDGNSVIALISPSTEETRAPSSAPVVRVLSTGDVGRIDFNGAFRFFRSVDSDDDEDIAENADEFISLASVYLAGGGEVRRKTGFLGRVYDALIISVGNLEYEITPNTTRVREAD